MTKYRLNRAVFKGQTASEAADHAIFYKNVSWQERLRISQDLNSIAYNYPENNPPRIDKKIFNAKSRNS